MMTQRRQHMEPDTGTARTLPEQGDPLHVPPKCPYVLPHPPQCHQLVIQPHVSRGVVVVQVEKAEQTWNVLQWCEKKYFVNIY